MAHSLDDSVLATYYIETKEDLHSVASMIAEIETTGKWSASGDPTPLFQQCHGEVCEVRELAPGKGEIDLLFPLINLNLEQAAFPSLWLTMVGGGTHALRTYSKSRLLDFHLPAQALTHFPGPRFGIDGTRRLLGVSADEALIGTIIKPTAGLTPAEVAEICYEAAIGGVRFIKDDEKMLNTSYCPLADRVRLVSQALRQAEEKTGRRVLYAPHITTNPDRLRDNAHIALENGANALMVNFFAAGFTALEIIARDPSLNVPVYAHCGGKEAFSRAPGQGVDANVVARLARLLGADYFRVSTVGGYLVGSDRQEGVSLANVLQGDLGNVRGTVPAVSGGLNPKNVPENLAVFGADVLLLAGTGITMHPMGVAAGTAALHQSAEAFKAGVSLTEYARDHVELRLALSR